MPAQTLLEKLQLKDEKNLLIQGLPSSLEKQFIKLNFAKHVTPLLKSRKVDFALVFAFSHKQLTEILKEVMPVLGPDAKFWIAYPKLSAKIACDLSRDVNMDFLQDHGYETVRMIALDNVWSGVRVKKADANAKKSTAFSSENPAPGIDYKNKTVQVPEMLQELLDDNKKAAAFFEKLAFSHKREYIEWIVSAKKEETKAKRLETMMEKLTAEKKSFNDK